MAAAVWFLDISLRARKQVKGMQSWVTEEQDTPINPVMVLDDHRSIMIVHIFDDLSSCLTARDTFS